VSLWDNKGYPNALIKYFYYNNNFYYYWMLLTVELNIIKKTTKYPNTKINILQEILTQFQHL
jgi:hypothetical protein